MPNSRNKSSILDRHLPRLVSPIVNQSSTTIESTFPAQFAPNPGGQAEFFRWIGLNADRVNPDLRFIYLRGGVNSGKTMSGAAFICARAIADSSSRSLITANTYGQLETSTIPGLVEFCDRHNIEIYPRRETIEETAKAITARRLCTITINLKGKSYKASILVLSAEAFTARTANARTPGAGIQVRSVWADEFSTAEKSAFDILNDRLGRGEGTLKGLGVITSTINKYNPYNWAYDLFDDPNRKDEQQKIFRSITVRTTENLSLDTDYYSSVAAGLTEEHRLIQLESEYVAVTEGRLISTFIRSIHALFGADTSVLKLDVRSPIHLALDFNRSPATATAWQVRDRGKEIIGLREWFLIESDTFELGDSIAKWIIASGHRSSIYLYGDASGAQKTANSRKTNWQIICDALSNQGISFIKRVPLANPDIQDSVNGLKMLFRADRLYINGDQQPELLKDLESVRWSIRKAGEIDKTDPMRTHLLDGLRYFSWSIEPYKSAPRVDSGYSGGDRLVGIVG
jgi:hypothetical protein